jgi:small GTP-binding protein
LHEEVFDEKQSKLVHKEMETLTNLITILESINAHPDDVLEIRKSIEQLRDLFLLVVIGEFNSGKSSFLNAMLGKKWLEEGVTPTTAQVNILRNGKDFKVVQRSGLVHGLASQDEHVEVHLPVPWLKQISLVDTPGTNAVVQGHQEITEHFVPRSDMVLFVTSCDRAFTESERSFLEKVRQYNKKVVVVLSKIDSLENPEKDLPQILSFVNEQTKRLFGFVPQIFPVSARMGLRAKIAASNAPGSSSRDPGSPDSYSKQLENSKEWQDSRFGPLESYILHTLNAKERGKLKLQNPLGIAAHFIKKYQSEQELRAKLIREDVSTLERIDNELEAFKAELISEYAYHEERIDSVLSALSERARNYLDDQLVITNAMKLFRSDVIREEFEKKVVADSSEQIDAYINDMIDWMLAKQAKQWGRVVEFATHRQQISNLTSGSQASKEMVGSLKSGYSYNRSVLISSLGDSAKKVVNEFDRRKEADLLAASVKAALTQTAVFEGVVIGIVCAYLNGLFTTPAMILKSMFASSGLSSRSASTSQVVGDSSLSSATLPDTTVTDHSSSLLDSLPTLAEFVASPVIQGSWITLTLLDITGFLGVTALAATGMVLLPYRKRQLHQQLSTQIADIRHKLKTSLKAQFDHQLQKGISELKENVSPYAHLVNAEKAKLEAAEVKLVECQKSLESITREIDIAFA